MRSLVEDTLKRLGKYSPDSANLILGTIAQESAYGKYRKQLGSGPALGICQMEPNTFNDIIKNYLRYNPEISNKIKEVCELSELNSSDLYLNDRLAICMCRVHYLRVFEQLPNIIEGYAKYWKKYYNTIKGKGTEAEFIRNYHLYVMNDID
jgi:hypothetical protein